MTNRRRFPGPWTIEEYRKSCFIIRDNRHHLTPDWSRSKRAQGEVNYS
jgi:hypothetical protein